MFVVRLDTRRKVLIGAVVVILLVVQLPKNIAKVACDVIYLASLSFVSVCIVIILTRDTTQQMHRYRDTCVTFCSSNRTIKEHFVTVVLCKVPQVVVSCSL